MKFLTASVNILSLKHAILTSEATANDLRSKEPIGGKVY
jgi:hypothetical protein